MDSNMFQAMRLSRCGAEPLLSTPARKGSGGAARDPPGPRLVEATRADHHALLEHVLVLEVVLEQVLLEVGVLVRGQHEVADRGLGLEPRDRAAARDDGRVWHAGMLVTWYTGVIARWRGGTCRA
jgi:hypothetical protein